jgi:hypothetical protein
MLPLVAVVGWALAALAAVVLWRRKRIDLSARVREHEQRVFAAHGGAMFRAQLLERRLASLLAVAFRDGPDQITWEELQRVLEGHYAKTFGQLLAILREHPEAEALVKVLKERVDERNLIAHDFFPDRAEALMTSAGRDAAIQELEAAADRLLDANRMLRRVSFEWLRTARGVTEADAEQTLRELRRRHGLPPNLPPHLR